MAWDSQGRPKAVSGVVGYEFVPLTLSQKMWLPSVLFIEWCCIEHQERLGFGFSRKLKETKHEREK